MESVKVAVIDEHAVFRRGAVTCLRDDPLIEIVREDSPDTYTPSAERVDVVVTSKTGLALVDPTAPVVVVDDGPPPEPGSLGDRVVAWLPRRDVTPDQLTSAVHSAAVGLSAVVSGSASGTALKARNRAVLELLASGMDIRQISEMLGYSERTIKASIAEVTRRLGARNRAQAVAEAVRRNLI